MSAHHDLFYDELGHSAYRNLIRTIPEAYSRYNKGFVLTIGDFLFTHIETSHCGRAIYSGNAVYKKQDRDISFSFQLVPGENYLDSVYFTVNINKPVSTRQCTCDSYDYFHFGCRCGALPNYSLKK